MKSLLAEVNSFSLIIIEENVKIKKYSSRNYSFYYYGDKNKTFYFILAFKLETRLFWMTKNY
jgi:hypothetical protein